MLFFNALFGHKTNWIVISWWKCIHSKHLPEKGSDHVCSLPPYLLPCTAEPGYSSPDHSERENDGLTTLEKNSSSNYGYNNFI